MLIHRAMQFKDISGQRFRLLTAQWPAGRRNRAVHWLCLCDCGTLKIVSRSLLVTRQTTNCGCVRKALMVGTQERKRAHDRAYYSTNKARLIASVNKWQVANRSKARIYKKKWKLTNPRWWDTPQGAKQRAAWKKAHPENARKALNKWRLKTPDKQAAYAHKRRASKLGRSEHFTSAEWAALQEQYGHLCLCCRLRKRLTVDHVIPLCDGGSDDIGNIQPLCRSCNSRKWRRHTDYRSSPSAA